MTEDGCSGFEIFILRYRILGALAAGTGFSNWERFSVGLVIPEEETLYRFRAEQSRAEQRLPAAGRDSVSCSKTPQQAGCKESWD